MDEGQRRRRHLLLPGTVVLIAVSLAAVAAGAFPGAFLPSHRVALMSSPPALPLLLAVQAGYLLCVCPLLMARRSYASIISLVAIEVGEMAVLLAAAAPLVLAAAWLSDATVADTARGVAYLLCVGLAALGLGMWGASGRTWTLTIVTLAAVLAVLAAPAVAYGLDELADGPTAAKALRQLSPLTAALTLGHRSAGGGALPVWAWLLWPAVGAVGALLRLLTGRRGAADDAPNADPPGA